MIKKIISIVVVSLTTCIFLLFFLAEVVNPHSFLDSFGAGLRVFVIIILMSLWFKTCPNIFKKTKRYGLYLCVFAVFIYTYAGVNLFIEDIGY
ncbi:MAG: hypothetical protein HRU38_07890 [Saccharospirillaceae bacterium]|nr:hypothetical protein [Pseudomonadales bacterium]NRB78574.1 hypothetical protein [Saccharospirillaceae bacterium]